MSFKEFLKSNSIAVNIIVWKLILEAKLSPDTQREIHFDNTSITSSLSEKLPGITLD